MNKYSLTEIIYNAVYSQIDYKVGRNKFGRGIGELLNYCYTLAKIASSASKSAIITDGYQVSDYQLFIPENLSNLEKLLSLANKVYFSEGAVEQCLELGSSKRAVIIPTDAVEGKTPRLLTPEELESFKAVLTSGERHVKVKDIVITRPLYALVGNLNFIYDLDNSPISMRMVSEQDSTISSLLCWAKGYQAGVSLSNVCPQVIIPNDMAFFQSFTGISHDASVTGKNPWKTSGIDTSKVKEVAVTTTSNETNTKEEN